MADADIAGAVKAALAQVEIPGGGSLADYSGLSEIIVTKSAVALAISVQPGMAAAFGLKAMSIGSMLTPGQAVVWRGPMATSALRQLLRETDWGGLDLLVVDLPPGTGDIQISLFQQAELAGAVIVSTPQDLALIDA